MKFSLLNSAAFAAHSLFTHIFFDISHIKIDVRRSMYLYRCTYMYVHAC